LAIEKESDLFGPKFKILGFFFFILEDHNEQVYELKKTLNCFKKHKNELVI
jgi:hypothetical protein